MSTTELPPLSHPVTAAMAGVAAALDELSAQRLWTIGEAELLAARVELEKQAARLTSLMRLRPFASCDGPVTWTRAHHIWHWSLGGPTAIGNLVLLCPDEPDGPHRDGPASQHQPPATSPGNPGPTASTGVDT